jgi:Uma2 family endonuclease
MYPIVQQLLTVEDFQQLPETNRRRELVRGEVIEVLPPGGIHGAIAVTLAALLKQWIRSQAGGYIGVEAGYILARNPDSVRGPDVSYVRAERIPAGGVPEGFRELAPDPAVKIVSPSETADDVRDKVRDYLAAGTPLVWVISPRT